MSLNAGLTDVEAQVCFLNKYPVLNSRLGERKRETLLSQLLHVFKVKAKQEAFRARNAKCWLDKYEEKSPAFLTWYTR